ncbi:MOSC domain-containing protein [Cochlodiniinecator piscidefendens]|uniref:MOSC domain-containing protein n=1 Tax=Cochlodiniinecator piscidefendens TaxID=2715756 RepID=UPI00140AA14C|nr:MOSC N-terminal beta barrel domain-containing protein [Cochlodiniinecator piscidefendens]
MITVSKIYRHPIKAHGVEVLSSTPLEIGKCLPMDRHWAVLHEAAKTTGGAWASCANFSRGAKAPHLMAIKAKYDEGTGLLTLRHPDLSEITFDPNTQSAEFINWVTPLMPSDRAASTGITHANGRGITDSEFASVAITNTASNAALSELLGRELSPLRWRSNIWLDNLPAWEEASMVGKTLRIGSAELEIREQITRCRATTANPETGVIDADTLGALKSLGHQQFGVYGVVTKAGTVAITDRAEIL